MNIDILVIGELGEDNFIYGNVERLSPEGPIPILKLDKNSFSSKNSGMAGNTYKNLKSLNPELNIFLISNEKPIKKTRFVDKESGYILLRVDEDDEVQIENINILRRVLTTLRNGNIKAVVISDYNKGLLTQEDVKIITSYCFDNNILTFLDTKKVLGEWSKNVDFVKINQKEWKYNINSLNTGPDLFCKNLIITLGSRGSMYQCHKKLEVINKPLEKIVEVKDVSGAGDTYLAAFVTEYLKSKNIERSMDFANKVSTIAVCRQGVVAVSITEVLTYYTEFK